MDVGQGQVNRDWDQERDLEQKTIVNTLNAFKGYEDFAKLALVKARRNKYSLLNPSQKSLLPEFNEITDEIVKGIKKNQAFLDLVADIGTEMFLSEEYRGKRLPNETDSSDFDKVFSTLRQVTREWTSAGQVERDQSYGVVLNELLTMYPNVQNRHGIRVLVPGSGLGRLPFELALNGFQAEGNEFSYYMLMASALLLNGTSPGVEYHICPFIHTASNNRSNRDRIQAVVAPDISPYALNQNEENDPSILQAAPGGLLSMSAGSFDEVYCLPNYQNQFDVITTVFFIDTAPNIFDTLRAIHNCLKIGGTWINIGPLLWHYEDVDSNDGRSRGLELSLEELLNVIKRSGFTMVKRKSMDPTTYTPVMNSMGYYTFECEFWVAKKT